ncbi:hypothetical protein ONA91_26080 [Micromonospora sp. DR5-3]|nr:MULTISPECIES: hypothetical protein [unclassified Micromonospora]MCW3817923.1 hypothetical protein [Micromonospora sp. DR5-3]
MGRFTHDLEDDSCGVGRFRPVHSRPVGHARHELIPAELVAIAERCTCLPQILANLSRKFSGEVLGEPLWDTLTQGLQGRPYRGRRLADVAQARSRLNLTYKLVMPHVDQLPQSAVRAVSAASRSWTPSRRLSELVTGIALR